MLQKVKKKFARGSAVLLDIVSNFDDYKTMSVSDPGNTYSPIGSWNDDKKGHFVYCKQPVTNDEKPTVFFLSYMDAHQQFNDGVLLSMPRAYPYAHHNQPAYILKFPSHDPLTYGNFLGTTAPTTSTTSLCNTTRYVPKGFQKTPAPSGSGSLPPLKPSSDPNTVPPPNPRRMPTPWSQSARGSQPSYPAPVETLQGQYFPYPPVDPNVNPGYYVPPIHTSPHTGFPGLRTPSLRCSIIHTMCVLVHFSQTSHLSTLRFMHQISPPLHMCHQTLLC